MHEKRSEKIIQKGEKRVSGITAKKKLRGCPELFLSKAESDF